MLSDINTLRSFVNVKNSTEDSRLAIFLLAADRGVKLFTKRYLESQVITEYPRYDTSITDIALYEYPVLCYVFTGTLTQGSPTVTGLVPQVSQNSVQGNLLVGMPAVVNAQTAKALTVIPAGATIQSVDSSSQVTLTQNAAQSGTVLIYFGLTVFLDMGGWYGDGPTTPFSSITQLLLGTDYVLQRDRPGGDNTSGSGLLRRLGGGPTGAWMGWPYDMPRGSLTARMPPYWPKGYGNVKVVYASGLGQGAAAPVPGTTPYPTLPASTTIPAELTYCVNAMAAWARVMAPLGVPLEVDAISQQVDRLLAGQTVEDPEIMSVRGILRRYRRVAW